MDIPMETPLPTLSEELIKRLDALYPVVQPTPGDTNDAIFYRAGQRSVVEFLLEQKRRQNETIR